MNITEEKINGILYLVLDHYEATISLAKEFKEEMIKYIEDGNDKIILDLDKVELMDSTFLGSLIVALRKMKEIDGVIKIVGVGESVGIVFGLTKMQNYFEIFNSKEEALASF